MKTTELTTDTEISDNRGMDDVTSMDVALKWIGVVTAILSPVAAVLAIYRYALTRLYALKLEPVVAGVVTKEDGKRYLQVTTRLKNIGASRAGIDNKKSYVRVFSTTGIASGDGITATPWVPVGIMPAFPDDTRIEAGETISDTKFHAIADGEYLRFRLDMKVVSQGILGMGTREWRSREIVGCAPTSNSENSDTEK